MCVGYTRVNMPPTTDRRRTLITAGIRLYPGTSNITRTFVNGADVIVVRSGLYFPYGTCSFAKNTRFRWIWFGGRPEERWEIDCRVGFVGAHAQGRTRVYDLTQPSPRCGDKCTTAGELPFEQLRIHAITRSERWLWPF